MTIKPIINIHTVVSLNSLKYFKYFINNHIKKSSNKSQLRFYAHCTDYQAFQELAKNNTVEVFDSFAHPKNFPSGSIRELLRKWKTFFKISSKAAGSGGHLVGLNSIQNNLKKGEINIIADADTVMLFNKWDLEIIKLLNTYGVIGTPYEDIGGFSSGNSIYQTYKQKPNVVWMAMSPKFPWNQLSLDHKKNINIKIINNKLSRLYNLPVGYELVRDVGWRIPSFLEDNNIPYKSFVQIKPTSQAVQVIKTGIDYHEEYHLDGIVFLAHQRGSNQHPFRGNKISKSFYDACEGLL